MQGKPGSSGSVCPSHSAAHASRTFARSKIVTDAENTPFRVLSANWILMKLSNAVVLRNGSSLDLKEFWLSIGVVQ